MKIVYLVKRHRIWIVLAGIVLFGLFLRLYKLGGQVMWVDETISALAARKIVESGVPVFSSGFFYSGAIIFHYIMAGFLIFFNNDFGARIVSVLFGCASVVLAFFIGREFDRKDKWIGIVGALFTAILFLEVYYSRQARFYQMFQFLFFLTLFFLYKLTDGKKESYAWASCISFIILVNTQIAGIVVAPFIFLVFWKQKMNWRFYVIPLIGVLYFGGGLFDISLSGESAGQHIEDYSSELYSKMRAFLLISFIGLFVAFRKNKKLLFFILVPSLVLFFGLFYVKVYAIRYMYFLVFPIILLFSLALIEVKKLSKFVFFLILIFAVVYPSNIFFPYSYLTQIKAEGQAIVSSTEPIIDYKSLSSNTVDLIKNSEIVSLWTPGVAWYLKNPGYFVPFSLNGLKSGYEIYNGVDAYTGAEIYSKMTGKFVYLEDGFGYGKLNETERGKVEELKKSCKMIEESLNLRVYLCNG